MAGADSRFLTRIGFVLLIAGAALAATHFFIRSHDRNVLWTIAHDKCVPDAKENHNPAPCVVVEIKGGEAQGYVILKDRRGAGQFLLIPTRRISGIEAPELAEPDAPNYWADAWNNRGLVAARIHRPLAWDMIGLAVNSSLARSQDQLHVHIDCVRPEVRARLAAHSGEIGPQWAPLSFDLLGHRYRARRLAASDLAKDDPFKLLAASLAPGQKMAAETLALIGVTFAPGDNGFVLLAEAADPAKRQRAHGEELLDRSCTVAK